VKTFKTSFYKIIRFLWCSFIILFVFGFLYIFAVNINLFNLFGGKPDLRELENPDYQFASEVYSADHVLIAKYYFENREPVAYSDIPPYLIKALISTEDVSFYKHSGIDPRGLLRVLIFLGTAGGGSTITQQLAKNLFDTRGNLYEGKLSKYTYLNLLNIKIKEWLLAIELEKRYTKNEIITMYLNTVPFGKGAHGIKVAAKTYFNKTPKELSVSESAMMVGIVNGPALFNPVSHPKRAFRKRNFVIYKLLKYGHISREKYEELIREPLEVNFNPEQAHGGAAYFKDVLKKYLKEWCQERDINLYTSGLKIYTSIDSRMQEYAEEAAAEHMEVVQRSFLQYWKGKDPWANSNYIESKVAQTALYKELVEEYGEDGDSVEIIMNRKARMKVFSWDGPKDAYMSPIDSIEYYEKFLHTGLMSMNKEGHIKAWVGGINHRFFKYDHVMQQKRQPGSTFKPVVYAVALENGLTPCSKIPDLPVTLHVDGQRPWSPQNDDGKYSGEEMTLYEAIGESKNLIAAQLIKSYGVEQVIDMAGRLGIDKKTIPKVPSIALGSCTASLYDMTAAFNTFLNQGTYVKPQFLLRVEDKFGQILYEEIPVKRDVLNEDIAFQMIHLLKAPIEWTGGTARHMPLDLKTENEIAGKTGTTSRNLDAWFIGFTKELTTGVWVGPDNAHLQLLGSGSSMAMPIWAKYMRKVYADKNLGYSKGNFSLPTSEDFLQKINCAYQSKVDSLFQSSGQ